MLYQNISSKIIQAAHKVYNKMGNGFLEVIYEHCMMIECEKHHLLVKNQHKIDVFYEKIKVGVYFADLFIENKIIVEIKAVKQISNIHHAQLLHYLTATGYRLGLLINYGSDSLYVKRIIN